MKRNARVHHMVRLISTLPEGIRQLAELRRKQKPTIVANPDHLVSAFAWNKTSEGYDFWWNICLGKFFIYNGCKVSKVTRK